MVEKVKANTLQERFGFADNDLRTPGHDAIMSWLDAEIDHVAEEYLSSKYKSSDQEIAQLERDAERWYHDNNGARYSPSGELINPPEWHGMGIPPTPSYIGVKERIWECPVTSEKKFIVGFIDMLVIARCRVLTYLAPERIWGTSLPRVPEWSLAQETYRLLFEVKTTIPSVGEVIRQIRMYQQFERGDYFVVSPDDRFASVLESQGIHFVKVPSA